MNRTWRFAPPPAAGLLFWPFFFANHNYEAKTRQNVANLENFLQDLGHTGGRGVGKSPTPGRAKGGFGPDFWTRAVKAVKGAKRGGFGPEKLGVAYFVDCLGMEGWDLVGRVVRGYWML